MRKIILASGSPRRKQLLEWAEIPFEVAPANINETYPPDLKPEEVALHIAVNKAQAVQKTIVENRSDRIIIAADTIVVLENKILGKPANREEAIKTLSAISGKEHEVITGVSLLSNLKQVRFVEKTKVTFDTLTISQMEYYIDTYKPYDKAGAYAIQEWIGVIGVKSITGDFYNVMGLPVCKVVRELKNF
jgi:septum formation protein